MVSQVLDFETMFGPPYRRKGGCNGLRVKCPFGEELGHDNGDRGSISSYSQTLGPSLWEMVRLDRYLVRSSMMKSFISYNPKNENKRQKPQGNRVTPRVHQTLPGRDDDSIAQEKMESTTFHQQQRNPKVIMSKYKFHKSYKSHTTSQGLYDNVQIFMSPLFQIIIKLY